MWLHPYNGDVYPSQGIPENKMMKVIFTWCVKITLENLFHEGDKSGSHGIKLNDMT